MVTEAETVADRVAADHTVVAEDVQWFYGVCRRVERETRLEYAPSVAVVEAAAAFYSALVDGEGEWDVSPAVAEWLALQEALKAAGAFGD